MGDLAKRSRAGRSLTCPCGVPGRRLGSKRRKARSVPDIELQPSRCAPVRAIAKRRVRIPKACTCEPPWLRRPLTSLCRNSCARSRGAICPDRPRSTTRPWGPDESSAGTSARHAGTEPMRKTGRPSPSCHFARNASETTWTGCRSGVGHATLTHPHGNTAWQEVPFSLEMTLAIPACRTPCHSLGLPRMRRDMRLIRR